LQAGVIGLLASPTAGYIVGFPIAAFIAGLITSRLQASVGLAATIGAVIGGILVLHAIGIVGMALVLGKTLPEATLLATPFLIGDAIKAVLAGAITQGIARMRPEALLSRS
jgi:biotin transport system substrate-specific component